MKDVLVEVEPSFSKYVAQFSLKLKSPLRKLYGRHHGLINRYRIFVSQMTMESKLVIVVLRPVWNFSAI